MTDSIVVYESTCEGGEHAAFNAGLLAGVLEIVPRAVFFAESRHIEAVREVLEPAEADRVDWRRIKIPPRRANSVSERLPQEWRIVTEVWAAAESENASAIINTSVSLAGLIAVKLRDSLHRNPRPVGLVFHSVLDRFMTERRLHRTLTWGNPPNLRYLILGESLLAEVRSVVPALRATTRAISLPQCFNTAPAASSRLNPSAMSFGFLGIANEYKGFLEFLALADEFASERVRFEVIGRVSSECQTRFEEFQRRTASAKLVISADGGRVPIESYRSRLASLSYTIFPYRAIDYRFVRSGAALDAIWAAKPMIAFRIPALEELFDRMGDVGYLCDNIEKLRATVADIIAHPPIERYAEQSANLFRGRDLFAGPAVGRELVDALGLRLTDRARPMVEQSK